jgi:hypothetical protein
MNTPKNEQSSQTISWENNSLDDGGDVAQTMPVICPMPLHPL